MLFLAVVLVLPQVRRIFFEAGFRWAYVVAVSFALGCGLTPLFGIVATSLDMVDRPDFRKSHRRPTPLLGGAAVFFAMSAAMVLNGVWERNLAVILIASTFIFATGVIDDRKEISASLKMAVQLGATLLVMCFGMVLRVLPEQLGFVSVIGNVFLTVLWIVGITNAMNFFDGMDGLAAGLGAIISFFLAIMAFQTSQPYLGWLALSLMGGCLGFLPHNFRKNGQAFIFLGDAGSTTIGFVLASIAVYGDWAENDPVVALVSPILIFWILIFDMVHISIDRVVTGKVSTVKEWLEYVGRDHLHHRLAQVIGSNKASVLYIYMLCICLGIGAVVLRHAGPLEAVLLVAQAFVLVLLITVLERKGRFGTPANGGGKNRSLEKP